MKKTLIAAAGLSAFLATSPVLAHVTGVEHAAGAGHPVLGIDHLLLVLAVAAVAGIVWLRNR